MNSNAVLVLLGFLLQICTGKKNQILQCTTRANNNCYYELILGNPIQLKKTKKIKSIESYYGFNGSVNFTYTVSLYYKDSGHFCTGSIISPSWIITAADCVMM